MTPRFPRTRFGRGARWLAWQLFCGTAPPPEDTVAWRHGFHGGLVIDIDKMFELDSVREDIARAEQLRLSQRGADRNTQKRRSRDRSSSPSRPRDTTHIHDTLF